MFKKSHELGEMYVTLKWKQKASKRNPKVQAIETGRLFSRKIYFMIVDMLC